MFENGTLETIKREYKTRRKFLFSYAFSYLLEVANYRIKSEKLYKFYIKKRDESIIKYISKYFNQVHNNHKNEIFDIKDNDETSPIFICWFQGEENAPPMVKNCINSIRKNAGKHEIHIITLENMKDYIEVPDYLMEKLENKTICAANFSDYVRTSLLYKHGGLWLDATVFCSQKIPEWIFECPFYSCKFGVDENMDNVSKGRWTLFILGGKKNDPLFLYYKELFEKYWAKETDAINYFLFDYFFEMAYRTLPKAKKYIDELQGSNPDIFAYELAMRNSISCKDWSFPEETFFYKLSFHRNYEKLNTHGERTVYDEFISGDITV